jgi:hypothetical protein
VALVLTYYLCKYKIYKNLGGIIMARTKKTKISHLKTEREMREVYGGIYHNIYYAIAFNLYVEETRTLENLVIMHGEKTVAKYNIYNSNDDEYYYDYNELEKEIKKTLIRNSLYVNEISADKDTKTLILNTSNDLIGLLYGDDEEEIETIKEELKREPGSSLEYNL